MAGPIPCWPESSATVSTPVESMFATTADQDNAPKTHSADLSAVEAAAA
jgi:hypothetical protein